jgi:endonuclease/exonuclease/phosphatase family metal-dependent hydrolase
MKIVFLNAWFGQIREPITAFVKQHARDTDVFCFQEAHDPMQSMCRDLLSDYDEVSFHKPVSETSNFLQATYVRKNIGIQSWATVLEANQDVGLGLWVNIKAGGRDVYICNFHGVSRPGDKLESPARHLQSQTLIDVFRDKPGLRIIGGDFNAFPETDCIRMFEMNGYHDLIKDNGITNTRNRLSWEKYPDTKQYFSDYVFVSDEAKVERFEVPGDIVSDHLAMIVEFA